MPGAGGGATEGAESVVDGAVLAAGLGAMPAAGLGAMPAAGDGAVLEAGMGTAGIEDIAGVGDGIAEVPL